MSMVISSIVQIIAIFFFTFANTAFSAEVKLTCLQTIDGVGHRADIDLNLKAEPHHMKITVFSGFEHSNEFYCEGQPKVVQAGKIFSLVCNDSNSDRAIYGTYRLTLNRGKWTLDRYFTTRGFRFHFDYQCGSRIKI